MVSVCIAAWNEELNIIRCLDSLSRSVTGIKFEILVINNNSTDRTQEVLDRMEVPSYFQPVQGCGISRELGQQKAKGEYILLADADCFYPEKWIDVMARSLDQKDIVATYGRYSFLGNPTIPRWYYACYEICKYLLSEIRHLKCPHLNTYGMSMGYVKKLGLKEGFDTRNIRGEDGRLCFDLMKHGKVRYIRDLRTLVWTHERNFSKEGGLAGALKTRLIKERIRFSQYFKKPPLHDTKTSQNLDVNNFLKNRGEN